MQPLKYSINLTLDGCCDHREGVADEAVHRHATAILAGADGLLFGRVTYQMMEEAWRAPAETGVRPDWMADWMMDFARTIHAARKYVVSDTLASVDWNAELIRGPELEAAVRRLKAEPGRGLYTGGVTLPQSLAELDLIDEYEFVIHPRVVGHSRRLFEGLSKPLELTLVGQAPVGANSLAMRYRPA